MIMRLFHRAILGIVAFLFCTGMAAAQAASTAWAEPVDVAAGTGEGTDVFAALVVDRWQNTHLLWGKQYEGGSAIYYTNDADGVWAQPVDVIAMPDAVAIRLSSCLTPDDILHLIWQNAYIGGDTYYSEVHIARAAEPGAWSEPVVLPNAGGQLISDEDGVLYAFDARSFDGGLALELYLVVSEDGGSTWVEASLIHATRVRVPSGMSGQLAIDAQGRIYVGITIRSTEYGEYSEVGYRRSPDRGATWGEYHLIDNVGTTFQGVYQAAPYVFGDQVHLTWHDPRRMHMWSQDGGESWSTPVEIMPLGAGFAGSIQLVEDQTGKLHTAMTTGTGVYACIWDGQRWGGCGPVDSRAIDPHFASIVLAQGNLLQVAYHDRLGDGTVWYSSRIIEAPHIPRSDMVQPAAEALAPADPAGGPETEPSASDREPAADGPVSTDEAPASRMSPGTWLWLPQVLVLLIVGAVLATRRQGAR